jgi:ubiquitin carboxyl-terminal hydrolase 5/13
MFRALVGRGHAEFGSSRQQDVVEYFQHLLEKLDVLWRAGGFANGGDAVANAPLPSALFTFALEDRVQDAASGMVRYGSSRDNVLSLYIPEEAAVNGHDVARYQEREAKRQKLRAAGAAAYISADGGGGAEAATMADAATADVAAADEAPVRPQVPFEACLARFAAAAAVERFEFKSLGTRGTALKQQRFASFPRYLAVQMARFYADERWQPLQRAQVSDDSHVGFLNAEDGVLRCVAEVSSARQVDAAADARAADGAHNRKRVALQR